jgi:hypothetical protein
MPSMQLPLRGQAACDRPTQQSSQVGNDSRCVDDRKTPTVIPAKAGIQCLSLNTRKIISRELKQMNSSIKLSAALSCRLPPQQPLHTVYPKATRLKSDSPAIWV